MQSTLPRIRRVGDRVPPIHAREPRLRTSLCRVRRRLRLPRRHRAGVVLGLDAAALRERAEDGLVQALGCLVWAAAACDPRVPFDALCDAAVELFDGDDADRPGLVVQVLRLTPEGLAERGAMIVAHALAPARAARFVALAQVRRAHADAAGQGAAATLARRALELVLDPLNPLDEALPRALALASRAAAHDVEYVPLVAALVSARDAAD